MNTGQPYPQAQ